MLVKGTRGDCCLLPHGPLPTTIFDNCFFPGPWKNRSKETAIDYFCQNGKDALIEILSGPGTLFEGKECTILRIYEGETG